MARDSGPIEFSSVVLTLLSIVVALAIEQLLSHVSTRLGSAEGSTRLLIAGQGLVIFLGAGAIWTTYATMIMTGSWEPRFQDFFAPLIILVLLYFSIQAIDRHDPAWFGLAAAGWANAFFGQRFALPPLIAERLRPDSGAAWRAHGTNLALCLLSTACAVLSWLGALGQTVAIAVVCLMAGGQLLAAWLHFQWFRCA